MSVELFGLFGIPLPKNISTHTLMFFLRILKSAAFILLTSFLDNTAGIMARRSTFTRKDRTQYLLPVVVTDSGSPALSSTSTLTISVCSCHPVGHCPTGGVEALALSMGVSLQTLLGLLVSLGTVTGEKAKSSNVSPSYLSPDYHRMI